MATKKLQNSKNYPDYVFRDGKLVGRFDDMYRNSAAVPWHQHETCSQIPVDIDLTIVNHFTSEIALNKVCDIGCGLGFVTNRLTRLLSLHHQELEVTGCDVSQAAIEQASERFKDIKFTYEDITSKHFFSCGSKFEFIYMKDVLWYVIDNIDLVIGNLKKILSENGMIYVMQSVPDKDVFVGQDLFPNAEAIVEFLNKHFVTVYSSCTSETLVHQYNRVNNIDRYARFLGKL